MPWLFLHDFPLQLAVLWLQDRKIKAEITVKDTGAHELQKVAKDHETYAVCQMPSQSKFFGYHG